MGGCMGGWVKRLVIVWVSRWGHVMIYEDTPAYFHPPIGIPPH